MFYLYLHVDHVIANKKKRVFLNFTLCWSGKKNHVSGTNFKKLSNVLSCIKKKGGKKDAYRILVVTFLCALDCHL